VSRPSTWPRNDHRASAAQARKNTGLWIFAGSYNSTMSARGAQREVSVAERFPSYRPAGTFEARVELTQDGANLFVRHLGTGAGR